MPLPASRLVAVAAALALLSTCTGLRSGNCGAEGQPCCGSRTCDSLLVCGDSETCEPCGGALQACCPNAVCGGDLLCNSNVCADSSCATACIPGTQRCSDAFGIDVCAQQGKCASWNPVVAACPSGFDCALTGTTAACVERCPGACTVDTLVCSSTGLKKCALDTTTNCPAPQPFADDSSAPVCLTGACAGNWCWESPTAQGTDLVSMDGWAIDQFWSVDAFGNILRRDGNAWTYEYLAQPLKTVRAITQCGSTQGYLMAVGDNGTVLRRAFGGTWLPENLGDNTAQLTAVGCTTFFRAFAVGQGGKVFVRDELAGGAWSPLASMTTANLRGATYYYSTGDGWAVGDTGVIVRCRNLNTPATATCATESSGVSTRLESVRSNPLNGDTVAVGQGGVVLFHAGVAWLQVATALTVEDLNVVAVAADPTSGFLLAGNNGVRLFGNSTTWNLVGSGGPALRSAFLPAPTIAVVGGADGTLWFNRSRAAPTAWTQLGGAGPVLSTLYAVTGLPTEAVWAAGASGALFRRNQAVWSREAQGVVQGDLFGVAVADGGEVVAVGDTVGDVALVGSPGRWKAEAQGTPEPLWGVTVDATRAYAVGNAGAWVERPLGPGGTWTNLNQGVTGETFYGVAARVVGGRAVEVTAVGGNCTVVSKTDAGFIATNVPGCNGDALFSVWEGTDGELLVGGESAFVARRQGGAWTREYLGATLETVRGVTQSNGRSWAVCENGELYSRVNGNWQQELPRFTNRAFLGAWANGVGDVWTVGTSGTVLRGR